MPFSPVNKYSWNVTLSCHMRCDAIQSGQFKYRVNVTLSCLMKCDAIQSGQ